MTEPKTVVPALSPTCLHFSGAGMTHPGKVRERNEDAILTDPECTFWAIADGMGGYGQGDIASEIVIDHLARMQDHGDAETRMNDLLQAANREIQERLLHSGTSLMGATVVALWLQAKLGHLAWVGDCRAYLCRDGQIDQVSNDHTVVANLVRDGLLSPENARNHSEANIVTRAVGAESKLDVDHCVVRLVDGDRIVLCSDGLTACLANEQILSLVLEAVTPESACKCLVGKCLEEGAPDNVSVIVIFVEKDR